VGPRTTRARLAQGLAACPRTLVPRGARAWRWILLRHPGGGA